VVEHLRVFDHVGFFCLWRRGRSTVSFTGTVAGADDETDAQHRSDYQEELFMGLLLLIILIVLLMGGLPTWRHSRDWGYGPSGGLGLLLVIVLILVVAGYVPRGF